MLVAAVASNIVRHPLFGRNSELPGESPFLNGHYAKEMVTGLQEEDGAGHPKVLAYLKHYTMYNGPQATDVPKEMVSLHDLHETCACTHDKHLIAHSCWWQQPVVPCHLLCNLIHRSGAVQDCICRRQRDGSDVFVQQ